MRAVGLREGSKGSLDSYKRPGLAGGRKGEGALQAGKAGWTVARKLTHNVWCWRMWSVKLQGDRVHVWED